MKTLIHIGMAKTATTTLQKGVFPHLENLNFLGVPGVTNELDKSLRTLCDVDDILLDQQQIAAELSSAFDPKRLNVISHENFALYKSTDKGLIARRLKNVFPDARILILIRNQIDLIRSWYLQQAQGMAQANSLISFDNWIKTGRTQTSASILDDLYYHDLISFYADLFGQKNVHVLCYEDMRHDLQNFSKALGDILEAPTAQIQDLLSQSDYNPTLTGATYQFSRFSSLFVPKVLFKIGQRAFPSALKKTLLFWDKNKAKPKLSGDLQSWLKERYKDSNRQTASLYKLPLEKYNYPL